MNYIGGKIKLTLEQPSTTSVSFRRFGRNLAASPCNIRFLSGLRTTFRCRGKSIAHFIFQAKMEG
jgi:hypothetical protein